MDLQGISILIISLTVFILSLSIFFKASIKLENKVFALILLFYSFWCFTSFINHQSISSDFVSISTKLSFVNALISLLLLVIFSEIFPKKGINLKKYKLIFYIIPATIIIFLTLFTPLIIEGALPKTYQNNEETITGSLFILFGLLVLIYLFTTLINLFISLKNSNGIYKEQTKYILIGTLTSATAGTLIGVVLPLIGITRIGYLAPYSSIFALLFIYYVIFKHRFLDVRVFVNKSLEVLVTGIFTYSFFYIVTYLDDSLFHSVYTQEAYLLGIIFTLIFTYGNGYLLNKLSRVYISTNFNYELITAQLNQLLGNNMNEKEISDNFSKFLIKNVHVLEAHIGIYTLKAGMKKFEMLSNLENKINHIDLTLFADRLHLLFKQDFNIKVVQELLLDTQVKLGNDPIFKLIKDLNTLGIEVIVPLKFEIEISGYIFLSAKESGNGFSIQDIKLIDNLAALFSLALQRAILYFQTQSFTQTLQLKVEEATDKLLKQNSDLEERYRLERDMIGIMGHELRTPLTIGRGTAEYLIKMSQNNPDTKLGDIYEKLQRVYIGYKRETDLVETLLSASKVDNNKLDLTMEKVDLNQIIQLVFSDFEDDARDQHLKFINISNPLLPSIKCEQGRVREVISNLVSNAIKYTANVHKSLKDGTVDMFTTFDENFVYLHVKDNGEGISVVDLENIGKKFFRANNYLMNSNHIVRPGGTGLGLYVIKGILKESGGDLQIESEVGKGSTFTAKFVIFKESENLASDSNNNTLDQEVDMFVKMGLN